MTIPLNNEWTTWLVKLVGNANVISSIICISYVNEPVVHYWAFWVKNVYVIVVLYQDFTCFRNFFSLLCCCTNAYYCFNLIRQVMTVSLLKKLHGW